MTVICGDVTALPVAGQFHAVLCDPPYHLTSSSRGSTRGSVAASEGVFKRVKSGGFMGKEWDGAHEVAFQPETWAGIAERLLPGGFLMAFGGSRTVHRLACAIEDAGLIIHPVLGWLFGTGFPKATRIDTQIDKAAGRVGESMVALKMKLADAVDASGKTRKQIDAECGFRATNYLTLPAEGKRPDPWVNTLPTHEKWQTMKQVIGCDGSLDELFAKAERETVGQQTKARKSDSGIPLPTNGDTEYQTWDITAPATPLAQAWAGHRYGLQALKPALELIVCAQKPYDGKPVDSIVATGAGALNIDGGRIGTEYITAHGGGINAEGRKYGNGLGIPALPPGSNGHHGRWPANFALDEHAAAWLDETVGESKSPQSYTRTAPASSCHFCGPISRDQEAHNYGDTGGPSRFYHVVRYQAKASRKERDAGLPEGQRNIHPTVKALDLCRWLATLLLPPAEYAPRRILVPFAGSGSEMIGAVLAGWEDVVGVEMSHEYCEIAKARLAHWCPERLF